MTNCLLTELFPLCIPDGGADESVRSLRVLNAAFDRDHGAIWLELSAPLPEQERLTLARSIAAAYGLTQVQLECPQLDSTPAPSLEELEKDLRDAFTRLYPPAAGFLAYSELEAQGNGRYLLRLHRGGAALLRPFLARLGEILSPRIEGGFSLTLEEAAAPKDIFSETERMRGEAIRQAAIAAPRPAPTKSKPKSSGGQNGDKPLLGRPIRGEPVPLDEVSLDMKSAVVWGRVCALDHREMKDRNAWIINFNITDGHGAIAISRFLEKKEAEPVVNALKTDNYVTVQGRPEISNYTGELQLRAMAIELAEPPAPRQDNAAEKRVELHLHTRFSTMDGLTEVKDAVAQAIAWGHPAIAITDHGVVQAFPDAAKAAKGKIKIIYGVEGYYVNDVDDMVAVRGNCNQPLTGELVCFDLETTGLSKTDDRITEIAAVLLRDGQEIDTFSTLVNPGRPISRESVELTGITDSMVKDAPSQEEALNAFLDWAGNRPMAAHNASFDTGFLAEGCRRIGRDFPNTAVDTLVLSQCLLPELSRYKLNIVSEHLKLPPFRHHRALADAGMVAQIFYALTPKLEELGVSTLQEINPALTPLRPAFREKGRTRAQHIVVLAKNQTGLRNLYKLVSLSHLEHFKRFPIMSKSLINQCREGLILGSACEAGELFRAVLEGLEWDELVRIASWYDYLEIQPVCNNMYLYRKGKVPSVEALRDLNRTIVRLGRELNKPVCATGDVHFLEPEDEIFRHILLTAKEMDSADDDLPLYFKTTDEMLEEFSYLGEEGCRQVVIDDPNRVARWVDTIQPLPKGLFAPTLENSQQELKDLVWGKARRLYGEHPPEIVVKRIEDEMGDIIRCHYDVIYMSAQKLVADSLEHGYLVGSRGSVGSSLVAFMAGITEVNSLPPHYRCPSCMHADFDVDTEKYGCGADMPDAVCPVCGAKYEKDGFNIPFETFLGFGGDKVPDIDLNFSGEYQAKAHRHTFELFGENHVFRAGTVGTVAEKTAYGYVLKYLEARGNTTATRATKEWLASGCVGIKRTTGQHPGGMVVIPGDQEIYDFCPVQHPADDPRSDIITTHFEYHSMEENLLKLDMLGHDDPSMIRMLQDLTGVDPQTIPLDDPDTMSLFTSSKALGYENDAILGPTGAVAIPEFNTRFTRGVLEETHPVQIDTLLRISGFTHGTGVWLGNARDLILSDTATAQQCVGCRDDIMLYLIEKGFEPKRAFKIMESVRKGRGLPEGAEDEMKEHGVPGWYIESCKKIKYLFPKAHAVAYVMMALRIAWFKVHRPLAFYAAYFSIRAKAFDVNFMCMGMETAKAKMDEIWSKDKPSPVENDMLVTLEVVYEFYLRGFSFTSIDLYRSLATRFIADEEQGTLTPPFCSCPGLGETAAQSIVEQREGRQFVSVEELSAACPKVSSSHIEMLRQAGALDGLPDTSQITLF